MTNRMREICTSGSVGALGGNPPQGDPAGRAGLCQLQSPSPGANALVVADGIVIFP